MIPFPYILSIIFWGLVLILIYPISALLPEYTHLAPHDYMGIMFIGSCLLGIAGLMSAERFRDGLNGSHKKIMITAFLQYFCSAVLSILFSSGIF